jgi:hypothetical protein
MYVRGDNRVGIGTVSPNYKLSVVPLATYGNAEDGNISISASASGGTVSAPTTAGGIVFGDQNVTNGYAGRIAVIQNSPSNSTASQMRFYTNSGGGNNSTAERVRITSAGDVGIGAVSPRVKLDVEAYTAFMSLSSAINSEATTVDQQIGGIDFRKHYALAISGSIRLLQSGGVNNYSQGHLAFYTNDGSTPFGSVPPEKMRITSNGTVLIGTTTDAGYKLTLKGTAGIGQFTNGTAAIDAYGSIAYYGCNTATNGIRINSVGDLLVGKTGGWTENGFQTEAGATTVGITNNSTANNIFLRKNGVSGNVIAFYYDGTGVGSIAITSSTTGYYTSSDYRLKQDLKSFNGLDLVSKIKVYDYEWKSDETRSYGVIAHELQEVIPQAVTGDKDAEKMQSVDYSKLVPILVASIQELKAEIELLKSKL